MTGVGRPSGQRRAWIAFATRELRTASRFALVGVVATLVHMTVVWVLVDGHGIPVFRGNCIAYLCAFGISFTGHHFWTFGSAGPMGHRFARFLLISFVAFLCNATVLAGVLRLSLFSPAVSALIAAATIPALTFVASRLWGFRGRD